MQNTRIYKWMQRQLLCATVAIAILGLSPLLHAQTDAPSPSKWSLGLRISYVTFRGHRHVDESFNVRTKSLTENSGIIAQYRPSNKLFWRFGITTEFSTSSQKVLDARLNRPSSDQSFQSVGLGTLVSIGHTFAPAKHPMLRRFRLSTGLNLITHSTVAVFHKNIAYAYGQNGEVYEYEGSSYDVRFVKLALNAFGLLEFQLAQKLHLGLEFYYGFEAARGVRREVGPIEGEPRINKTIHSTNGMINPAFTITKSF